MNNIILLMNINRICNLDERALFYIILPNKPLYNIGQSAVALKNSEERLSLVKFLILNIFVYHYEQMMIQL